MWWSILFLIITIGATVPFIGHKAMERAAMPTSVPPACLSGGLPQPDEAEHPLPLFANVRTALLDRLEAWIDEEERLIAEIERKIAATIGAAATPWAHAKTAYEVDEPTREAAMTEPLAAT